MGKYITKIKLFNFKKFRDFSIDCNSKMNVIVGDNEAGKSSLIEAIDLVLSGSRSKVDNYGLEHLMNNLAIDEFLRSDKSIDKLPSMMIEVYLNEQNNFQTSGKNNSEKHECDGLRLICQPSAEFKSDIESILEDENVSFPVEFYSIEFSTFAGVPYNGHKHFMKSILIDSSLVSRDYAMREYVRDLYATTTTLKDKLIDRNQYRSSKETFSLNILQKYGDSLGEYQFGIKNDNKSNLDTDLTIQHGGITLDNEGTGTQNIVKAKLALNRNGDNLDVILFEEPENHLSHINMLKLMEEVKKPEDKQLFFTTHNDLICSRLNLRNIIILGSDANGKPVKLDSIDPDTAEFFEKASNTNLLQFVLSSKVILVEGSAEYILMEALYKNVIHKSMADDKVHVISVSGLSFIRYLSIAEKLNVKTAVITDNDGDYDVNIKEKYNKYLPFNDKGNKFIKVFSDSNNERRTFEVCIYKDNEMLCRQLFLKGDNTQKYMLSNKASSAYELLKNKDSNIVVPTYIKEAIEWIKN